MVCLLNLPFVYRSSRNEIRHLFTVVYGHINETIGDFAKDTMNLSTFAAFFQILDLESVLYAPEPMQMFAPTDDAFDNLLRNDLNISLKDLLEQDGLIEKILAYHVVMGTPSQGNNSNVQETLLPGYTILVDNGTVTDGMGYMSNIIMDLNASNGELFVIDRVLLPALANVPI